MTTIVIGNSMLKKEAANEFPDDVGTSDSRNEWKMLIRVRE